MKLQKKYILFALIFTIVIAGSAVYSIASLSKWFDDNSASATQSPSPSNDRYISFTFEVFDKIKENFWDKVEDEQLSQLYKLAVEKITAAPAPIDSKSKEDVANLVAQIIKDLPDEKKKEFIAQLTDIVLANLKPFGRSRLYTTRLEEALKNTVDNVDPSTDLYAVLDLKKGASVDEVKENYEKKAAELKNDKSPEAQQKIATIQRAFDALSAEDKKSTYDAKGIEPTVIYKLLTPDIFYMKLTKFSPQSFDELKKAADSIDPKKKGGPTALIFDLRGNIGGAIDILQYFLGPFIGPNNYAYDFFHQGDSTPYKTKIGWFESLVRYKKVVILIDEKCQSSSEVMAATLKKYNVGVLVGVTTKGWGTVEQVIPLENQLDDKEKFSMFLVHSITLREDGQPIEGRGVDPMININDKDWPQQLLAYYNYPGLVDAVKKLIANK